MNTFEFSSNRSLSCLAISAGLVLLLCSSSWARKEERGPQPPGRHPGGTVVEVPGPPGVPLPGGVVPVPPNLMPRPPGVVEQKVRPQLRDLPGPPNVEFHGPVVLPDKRRPRQEPPPPRLREHPEDRRWERPDREFRPHRDFRPDRRSRPDRDFRPPPWDRDRRPRFGAVHRELPRDTFRFFLGGIPFFYTAGVYFRPGPEGYVVVAPPIGARVRILPEECSFFFYRGDRCYSCDDDVFYREIGGEYEVIAKPPRFRLIARVGDEVTVEADTLNVRMGPGRGYDVVNMLHRGETAEVGGIDGDWYYVNLPDGSYGWIVREYTTISSLEDRPKG